MSSKYDSFLDSFAAFDMYNLPMPVVPPADLSIAGGAIVSTYISYRTGALHRVVDFSPLDNPYIRAIGLASNLADGLVNATVKHDGGTAAWNIVMRPLRFSADLTGTIVNTGFVANVNGSVTITGTGTLFTRELGVGATLVWIDDNGTQREGRALSITSDTVLTLAAATAFTGMFQGATNGQKANIKTGQDGYAGSSITVSMLAMNVLYPLSFFVADASLIFSPRGKITTVAGSAAVIGVGTLFMTEMDQEASADLFTVVTTDVGDTFAQPTGIPILLNDTALTITALTSTTGPVIGTTYYVVGSAGATFQLSLTVGGAAITLTTNGSAQIRLRGSGYVIGWVDDLGNRQTGIVASIESETALTLTAVVQANGGGVNKDMLNLDNSLRIRMEMPYDFNAYTISIDPAYGADNRRLSISVLAEVEHTFGMDGSL